MSIVKTDLVSQFGAYYINEGQNMERLLSLIKQPAVTPSYAKPLVHDGDVYRFANVKMAEMVQSFQKGFTAKGDVTFTPNTITLHRLKVDISLYPDDVTASWMGFMASLTDQERANWPIVRYMLEKEIIPGIPNDLETKAYWGGQYVAPTAGTAGTTAQSMDGLKKKLDAGLAETDLNKKMKAVALTSAPTASTMVESVEEFTKAIDQVLLSVGGTLYMEPAMIMSYLQDKRNTYGTNINYDPNKLTVDFADNVKLRALPSMAGSGYMFYTPDDNFLYIRKLNGMQTPKVEESLRQVFLMLDWYEALGFGYNPLVYVYKPA